MCRHRTRRRNGSGQPTGEQVYAQLRQGQVFIEQLHTKQEGETIQVPGGLIHHWVGVAFIDGAALAQTATVLQDYDNHKKIYKPDVRQSMLLAGKDPQARSRWCHKP